MNRNPARTQRDRDSGISRDLRDSGPLRPAPPDNDSVDKTNPTDHNMAQASAVNANQLAILGDFHGHLEEDIDHFCLQVTRC